MSWLQVRHCSFLGVFSFPLVMFCSLLQGCTLASPLCASSPRGLAPQARGVSRCGDSPPHFTLSSWLPDVLHQGTDTITPFMSLGNAGQTVTQPALLTFPSFIPTESNSLCGRACDLLCVPRGKNLIVLPLGVGDTTSYRGVLQSSQAVTVSRRSAQCVV